MMMIEKRIKELPIIDDKTKIIKQRQLNKNEMKSNNSKGSFLRIKIVLTAKEIVKDETKMIERISQAKLFKANRLSLTKSKTKIKDVKNKETADKMISNLYFVFMSLPSNWGNEIFKTSQIGSKRLVLG